MCYYFCFIFSLTISTKSFTLLQTLRLHCISLNFSTFLVSSRFSEFYFVWGESYDWVSSMLERKVNVLTKKDDHWKKRSYLCFHVLGVEAGTSLVHSSGTRIINSPHQSLNLQEITLTLTLLSTTFSSALLHSSLLKQFLLCHMSQDILIWKSKFHSDCSSHWSLHYPYQDSDWKPLSSWFSYFRFIWNNKPNHCFKFCWKCTKWHKRYVLECFHL